MPDEPELPEAIKEAVATAALRCQEVFSHGTQNRMKEERWLPHDQFRGIMRQELAKPIAEIERQGRVERIALGQPICEGLKIRGHWVPKDSASSDVIGAVFTAIDQLKDRFEATNETLSYRHKDIKKLVHILQWKFGAVYAAIAPNQRTFERSDGVLACNECCDGDHCDDDTHRNRDQCPYCCGTGRPNFDVIKQLPEMLK